MTLRVPAHKLIALLTELDWDTKVYVSKRQFQSFIGKLNSVSIRVRSGRVFLSCMLQLLWAHSKSQRLYLDSQFYADFVW